MKKISLILLALALMAGLFGCANGPVTPEPTPPVSQSPTATVPAAPESPSPEVTPTPEGSNPVETPSFHFIAPAGTVVYGVDISRMIYEDAYAALARAIDGYTHSVLIGEKELTISAQDVALKLNEAQFTAFWENLKAGSESYSNLFSLDSSALEQVLSAKLEFSAKNPSVVYSRDQQKFVVIPGSGGMDCDIPAIANWVAPSMCSLYASSSGDGFHRETAPSVSNDDPRVTAAVEKANGYLDLVLVYAFIKEDGGTINETFLKDTVAPMIRIGSDYSVGIDRSVVEKQVTAVAKRHSSSHTGNFVTTGGETLSYTVTYYDRQVDVAAMTEDLYTCLTTGVSGQRIAPYLSAAETALPYGGSYIEIDLTAQQLWVYKNGECVVSTPIVSGCVAEGNNTPTGVFSIYKKAEDAWLAGPTWLDHVDYWMPFYGAYGLHDASWRNEFGGEIYINEGSHGCPNLPVDMAGQVYHNISVGTPVVIYGGASAPYDLTQEITGTTVYHLPEPGQSFPLDITLKYPEAVVTYTSDNPAVATVSADGVVTAHGKGTAHITVSAAAFTHHTAAEFTVQVNVSVFCEPEDHNFGSWVQDTIPGCEAAGSESRVCSACGSVDTREVPPAGHVFDEWVQTTAPGCKTAGSEQGICSVCEAVEEREVPATGHSFKTGNYLCTNGCGTINPDFIFPSSR